jgi:hypothetical protein
MKSVAKVILFFIVVIALAGACRKFETFPAEPEITFEEFVLLLNTQTGITERGVIKFNYTDGDGDLGLGPHDTLPPFNNGSDYYYNMIIKYFEKQNGEFVEIPIVIWNAETQKNDTVTFNSRFPVLTPGSGNMNIKGLFQDTVYVYNPISNFDTIKFKVSIYDRALHLSNEIETPEIVVIK